MSEPDLLNRVSMYPELVAVAVLILGLIGARLLSVALGYVLETIDRRIARLTTSDASVLTPRLIAMLRAVVFWVALILAVYLALRILGMTDTSLGLRYAITDFVPQALVAIAIVVAGQLIGVIARNLAANLSTDLEENSVGPRLLHGVIVGVAVVVALQNVGINLTFFTRLMLILTAIAGGGLMLAFAFGARRHVANLLAHRELDRIAIGERIRIDGVEGTVVEIRSTAVDIATDQGTATVPAARFAKYSILRLREDQSDA